MTRVTIDAATLAKLQAPDNYIEVCDESGKVIGHFSRVVEPPRGPDGKIISPISDEEWERLRQEPGGRRLKDILADLQNQ